MTCWSCSLASTFTCQDQGNSSQKGSQYICVSLIRSSLALWYALLARIRVCAAAHPPDFDEGNLRRAPSSHSAVASECK